MTNIRKLLIANRGEIAVRIARTARDMGIATVAVYSEPDASALHVSACDEAIALGGATPGESYLRADALLEAADRTGADAIHPGYGFLAENADFARRVVDADLTWVGPHPEAIASMGDKLQAKSIMTDAGVPVLASAVLGGSSDGDGGGDGEADQLEAAADEIGFPLLVKAAAGGGGKGMRVVRERGDLEEAVGAARREAAGAFGDDRVFLERFVERPRHVEIQILGDRHGNLVHLFERECSIQRRHQKVIEETPSSVVTPSLRKEMGQAAVAAGRALDYDNAGTVEFVLGEPTGGTDGNGYEFAFLEVNTRLQVEHPVTEMVVADAAGRPIDLVRQQLLVAGGERLTFTQDELVQRGHAIEARLYAEDPANDYLPATGRLHDLRPASGSGTSGEGSPADAQGSQAVRWDTGVVSGTAVSPHYDPLLAKVIASAPTRREAAGRLARELEATSIHGVTTNRDLLAAVLSHPAFLAGDTTTAFLDEHFPSPESRTLVPDDAAVGNAAVAAALAGQAERAASQPQLTAVPSGWRNNRGYDQRVRYRAGDRHVEVHYRRERDGTWTVAVDGESASVRRWHQVPRLERTATAADTMGGPGTDDRTHRVVDLEVDGHRFTATVSTVADPVAQTREVHVVTPAGQVTFEQVARFPRAGLDEVPGAAVAPMPGSVVAVEVEEGDEVQAGDLLLTLEAMKMEHRVTAPHDGTVTEIKVTAGDQVGADAVLVVVEEE